MSDCKQRVVHGAAELLATRPYATLTLRDIAQHVGMDVERVSEYFPDLHDLGTAILTLEGSSMRAAQKQAQETYSEPLECLKEAFRLVGCNLAKDVIVRAGIRIAAESSSSFPERNINPFRTWEAFVKGHLQSARERKDLRPGIDADDAAWLFVSAGMGTKDLLTFSGEWSSAEARLLRTAELVIESIRVEQDGHGGTR